MMLMSAVMITGCSVNNAGSSTSEITNSTEEISNESETAVVAQTTETGDAETAVVAQTTETGDTETEEQDSAIDNKALEEQYIEAVKNLYENNIDLFGNIVENFHDAPEYNKFAIADVDNDGALELILSWKDSTVAGRWGGVYQYDLNKQEYYSEGLREPEITFYDNGVAYEPWRHNQGPSEMWPFDASLYNADTDQYEHAFSADSWSKNMVEENFPDDIDTDGAGVVYYTDINSEEGLDYDNPISQSAFDSIYNQYFGDAKEISIDYYKLSEEGMNDYLSASRDNSGTAEKDGAQSEVTTDEALLAFAGGDMSVLADGQIEEYYIPDFAGDDFTYEYTFLDLDADNENELVIQKEGEPQGYLAIFNADAGKVYCWFSDSIEVLCYDYPLDNGLMVHEYDYGEIVTYSVYSFAQNGQMTDLTTMVCEEPTGSNASSKEPEYRIDDQTVSKEEFEEMLKTTISDHLLSPLVWTKM
jgi:hypothetical protein